MLAWVCDMIVAADDASFRDNVVGMGVCGVEFFNHVYDLGSRKAKEFLMTGDALNAYEAKEWGMVNHVVPRADLDDFVLNMARKIAEKPMFALQTTKEAVNQVVDAAGRPAAMNAVFALHHLCHSHNLQVYKLPMDPAAFSKPGNASKRKVTSKL